MGTPVTSEPWTIKVTSTERKASVGKEKPYAGNELFVINFDLTNSGTKDAAIAASSFTLADRIGSMMKAAALSDPAYFHQMKQPLKAGTTHKVKIAYEVRKGAGPFQWIYAPMAADAPVTPVVIEVK
jgi:hypothetical protein